MSIIFEVRMDLESKKKKKKLQNKCVNYAEISVHLSLGSPKAFRLFTQDISPNKLLHITLSK